MYRPVLDALSGSLALTALVAMLPLLTLFIVIKRDLDLQHDGGDGASLLILAGLITIPVIGVSLAKAFGAYLDTYRQWNDPQYS